MSDRYLYKAKRKHGSKFFKKGEWVEGAYYIEPYTDKCFIIQWNSTGLGFNEFIEVDGESVCQCTGLKDKNGNLIWENDIVSFQFDNDDCPFPNKDTKKRIGKVFFSDFRASWSIAMGKNGSKSLNNDLWKYVQNGNRVEIVGNIFDNPELLE